MSKKSVLARYRSKLGTVPDQKIAELAKVSRTLVVNYRNKLGIPAYQGHRNASAVTSAADEAPGSKPFRGRRSALDAYTHQLGKVPDAEIARLAGVTAENVRTYRRRRNIAAEWQGADGMPGPAVAEAPVPARVQGTVVSHVPQTPSEAPLPKRSGAATATGTAYVVSVETTDGPRTYAVIAEDIASAAREAAGRVAARHPKATIRAIQRVAELFPA